MTISQEWIRPSVNTVELSLSLVLRGDDKQLLLLAKRRSLL